MEKKPEEMNEQELLRELLKHQSKHTQAGRIAAVGVAVLAAVLLISSLILVPQLVSTLARANATLEQANTTLSAAEELVARGKEELTELDKVAKLAEESLGSLDTMADNVNTLVGENTEGLQKTVEKLNQIDLEKLNKSIDDLNKVIAPLAKLFGRN